MPTITIIGYTKDAKTGGVIEHTIKKVDIPEKYHPWVEICFGSTAVHINAATNEVEVVADRITIRSEIGGRVIGASLRKKEA